MTATTLAPGELGAAIAVGESGSPNERPMQMLVEAIDPEPLVRVDPTAASFDPTRCLPWGS